MLLLLDLHLDLALTLRQLDLKRAQFALHQVTFSRISISLLVILLVPDLVLQVLVVEDLPLSLGLPGRHILVAATDALLGHDFPRSQRSPLVLKHLALEKRVNRLVACPIFALLAISTAFLQALGHTAHRRLRKLLAVVRLHPRVDRRGMRHCCGTFEDRDRRRHLLALRRQQLLL